MERQKTVTAKQEWRRLRGERKWSKITSDNKGEKTKEEAATKLEKKGDEKRVVQGDTEEGVAFE